jgi:murein tripeptide amidase MpaA
MQIDCDFEGGSIQILDATDPAAVALALRQDNASDYKQWFYFQVRDAAGVPCSLQITDAGRSSYPSGWSDYRACASYDGETWFRVPADFDGEALTIRHTPEREVVTYACYAPYSLDRHKALLARARASRGARVIELGKSVEQRPISAIVFGDQERPQPRVWIIAHQHPGETMAGWFMEGVLERLLDEGDPVTAALLDKAEIYLVPMMNPDGTARGNHRTNAAGRDLNREWLSPSLESSPEVFHVRNALEEGGVDLFLDVHGDESIPYVFAFGTEGVSGYEDRRAGLEELFGSTLLQIDGDFQRVEGYDREPPGEADLRLASMYVASRFDCLSLGLEMPFKDNANLPDEDVGWSPERCRHFGRSVLEAVLGSIDSLR